MTSVGSWRKQESSRKTFTSPLLTTPKPLTVCLTTNWKFFKEMGIPDHFTCLLRNPYAGQEATVRTGHEITDWFQIRNGVCQGCILSPCLFNLHAEYIMQNAGLDEAQAGVKIGKEISITTDVHITPPLWQKTKSNWRASWWKWKRRVKKLAYSATFKKLRSWHLVPSLHGK